VQFNKTNADKTVNDWWWVEQLCSTALTAQSRQRRCDNGDNNI